MKEENKRKIRIAIASVLTFFLADKVAVLFLNNQLNSNLFFYLLLLLIAYLTLINEILYE